MPSSDGGAALESAEPGDGRGTSRNGAGGRGVATFHSLWGASDYPPVATRPGLRSRREVAARRGSPARTLAVFRRAVWATPYPTRSAAPALLDSNCGGLFAGQVTADIHNMFAFAEIIAHRSDCCEAKAASTFPTNKHTDFHVFPLAFPDGRADCTAAQAKPSRHDKTIVVQPCSHPMPSPVS